MRLKNSIDYKCFPEPPRGDWTRFTILVLSAPNLTFTVPPELAYTSFCRRCGGKARRKCLAFPADMPLRPVDGRMAGKVIFELEIYRLLGDQRAITCFDAGNGQIAVGDTGNLIEFLAFAPDLEQVFSIHQKITPKEHLNGTDSHLTRLDGIHDVDVELHGLFPH